MDYKKQLVMGYDTGYNLIITLIEDTPEGEFIKYEYLTERSIPKEKKEGGVHFKFYEYFNQRFRFNGIWE